MSSLALANMPPDLPYAKAVKRIPYFWTIPIVFVAIVDNRHYPANAPEAGLGIYLSQKHYPGTLISDPPAYFFVPGPELHALELILLTAIYHSGVERTDRSRGNRTDIADTIRNNYVEFGIGRQTFEEYCLAREIGLDDFLGPIRMFQQPKQSAATLAV